MNKITLLIIGLFVAVFSTKAQVVTTNPTFPTEGKVIEVIFDASLSSGGLATYTGTDIYAHTGVITDKSTNNSDWKYAPVWKDNSEKYKLTSLGNKKWKLSLSPDIRSYYGVPAGEKILKMAFVFRNGTATAEGKDNGKDIMIDVFEDELAVKFLSPDKSQLINKGSTISLSAQASATTNLKLFIDNTEIASISNSTSITKSYTFATEGSFWAIAEGGVSPSIIRDSIFINVKKSQVTESRPIGTRSGINIVNDNTATFVLYAPHKSDVFLIGDFNDWMAMNDYMLKKDGDYWWITLNNLEKGKEYAFQYLVDGSIRIADPYTDKILDPWNDSWITSATYPNLKPYPTGKTEEAVSIVQTGQTPYNWNIANFTPPARNKMVIYELLIRDFTEGHSFTSTMAKLDYLQKMGVNVIELLPVNEFEGNNSWGYNPSFYFAVDKYYGHKDTFKAFVDECHRRGIAVVIDMVLNHSFGQSPFARLYWDSSNNRPASNNPWYNTTSPNTTYQWGSDFNHTSDQTKALVDSVNSYWMKEYKVDGFRFDFTKGFTNKPGDGWAYDQSRIDILTRMANEIYKRKSDAIVIFEHLTDNSEEKILSDNANIMLWGNMNNSYCEGIMGWTSTSNLSGTLFSDRGWTKPNLVSYMESHDEERMMYKALTYGNTGVKGNLNESLKRAELSAAFFIPLPGPKMIWQFGELGYDYSINHCENGTTNNNCRVDPKPIKWDYLDNENRHKVYTTYSKLAELKQSYDVFNSTDISYSLTGATKHFIWRSGSMNAFVVGNFDVTAKNVTINLPKAGTWYSVMDDSSINMATTSYSETLQPGEFRFYTDTKVALGIEDSSSESNIIINDNIISTDKTAVFISVYNLSGVLCKQTINSNTLDISNLNKGIYIVKIKDETNIRSLKFIKK